MMRSWRLIMLALFPAVLTFLSVAGYSSSAFVAKHPPGDPHHHHHHRNNVPPRVRCFSSRRDGTEVAMDPVVVAATTVAGDSTSTWMREGLLMSSFSDGLLPNIKARDCLSRGLVRCLLTEGQQVTEQALEASVRSSPCNGPNMEVLQRLERCDRALLQLYESNHSIRPLEILRQAFSDKTTTISISDSYTFPRPCTHSDPTLTILQASRDNGLEPTASSDVTNLSACSKSFWAIPIQ